MTGIKKCRRFSSGRGVAAASSSSLLLLFVWVAAFAVMAEADSSSPDYKVIMELRNSTGLKSDADCSSTKLPCDCGADGSKQMDVRCGKGDGRVTYITFQAASGGSLPASLENLTELSIFEAGSSNLNGTIPNFGGAIWEISIHDNQFTKIIPQILFQSKPSLTLFDVSNNKMLQPWTIPADALKSSSKLRSFSAGGCNMEGPFPGIFNPKDFPVLRVLTLSGNSLTGPIPQELMGLTEFESLEWLDVSNNQLTGSIPESVANLPSLRHLDVSNNHIK
ncbi:unnamed protein product [Cuscuta europaea]|uniref:Leucine-rich repeat-containing N-terminal plant-type domain-containing protein n=1 Tax=Cuscuta europaea TaxID=41803 RepID=A0A9P0YQ01_CUSEU|nr:unnamed protein product [Cuscuta europaea]